MAHNFAASVCVVCSGLIILESAWIGIQVQVQKKHLHLKSQHLQKYIFISFSDRLPGGILNGTVAVPFKITPTRSLSTQYNTLLSAELIFKVISLQHMQSRLGLSE